jgi:hypothetical protein
MEPTPNRGLPGRPDGEVVVGEAGADCSALPSDSVPCYAVNGTDLSVFEPMPAREFRGHTVRVETATDISAHPPPSLPMPPPLLLARHVTTSSRPPWRQYHELGPHLTSI